MSINLKNEKFNKNAKLLERDPLVMNSAIPTNNVQVGHDFIVEKTNPHSSVEEKVAHLSLQINQVIVKPYLQQALDYLKNSKLDATNAYNQLSDQIATEVKIISQNTNEIANRLKDAQNVIARTQEAIRNKYNNATEEEIETCELNLDYEYNIIAEHYELSLQLTQELSRYKSRIDTLLSSQHLLDESMIPAVSRIQLEIDNLELLLHGFDSSDYASILAKKQGRSSAPRIQTTPALASRAPALNQLVESSHMSAYQNINSVPRIDSMNRYEDPMNANINVNRQVVKPNYIQPPYESIQKNNNYVNNENYQSNNVQPIRNQTLTWRERRLQQKIARQESEIRNLERLQARYNQNAQTLEALQMNAANQQAQMERFNQMQNFSRTQQSNVNYNSQIATPQAQKVYEARIPLETLDENLAKSPRDKIFVVRQSEPITQETANRLAKDSSIDTKIRTIKVIK